MKTSTQVVKAQKKNKGPPQKEKERAKSEEKKMERRRRARVNYTEPEEAPVSPSDLLGDDVSEADVRAATERLRGRLARKRREPPDEGREPRREPERREAERREPERAECAECEETVCPAGLGSLSGLGSPSGPAAGLEACKAVYRVYNKWGGVDGAIGEGLTGTLTPGHMCAVLHALGVAEREATFVDIGAADGRALVCAAMLGAKRVVGYELPRPGKIHENVMNGVRALLSKKYPGKITAKFEYVKKDIAHESAQPEGTTAVYSFWDGFQTEHQEHVLRLICACPTLRSACVFLKRMKGKSWTRDTLLDYLRSNGRTPVSAETRKVNMSGSGEEKSAIVFGF
jgi:hypothetical protein